MGRDLNILKPNNITIITMLLYTTTLCLHNIIIIIVMIEPSLLRAYRAYRVDVNKPYVLFQFIHTRI